VNEVVAKKFQQCDFKDWPQLFKLKLRYCHNAANF